MAQHSSLIGGSNASQRLSCPGSYQATQALPPGIDIDSEYAKEGTAMHAVMASLLEDRRLAEAQDIEVNLPAIVADLITNKTFFIDRALTQTHIDDMILPALERLEALEAYYGGGFRVVSIEETVRFPGVPGAWGTCDLILASAACILHIDWKFGSGVGVAAVYADEHGERVNAQLMFYLTAAFHTLRKTYRNRKTLVVAIIQPRNDLAPMSHTIVKRKEMTWFAEDVENAIVEALKRNPPKAKGEHCRWAPCKTTCELWTMPVLDFSKLGVVTQTPKDVEARKVTPYGEYLAHAKKLGDMLSIYKTEIDNQLHTFLENGGQVPGWRLKDKIKNRQWVEPAVVEKGLKKLGFKSDEIWQDKLVTFSSADATAKRLGKVIPAELRVAPPSTETTIAPADDPAPVVDRAKAIDNFRNALRLLSAPKA